MFRFHDISLSRGEEQFFVCWTLAPLECVLGGLVMRGVGSYAWRVTTVPVGLLYCRPDRRENVRS